MLRQNSRLPFVGSRRHFLRLERLESRQTPAALAVNTPTSAGGDLANINLEIQGAPATGTVQGTVFVDVNGNGALDSGESGMGSVTVFADTNLNGKLDVGEVSTTTATNGTYTLTLAPGSATIRQVVPAGLTQTSVNPAAVTVTAGGNVPNINFGNQTTATTGTVQGTVFTDVNGNGALDSGESGIGGVTVFADVNGNGKLDFGEISTTTAANGTFSLTLTPGTVSIRQVVPAGLTQTSANPAAVTVTAGGNVPNINFGNQTTATTGAVQGVVFHDVNGNGSLDGGEVGMGGVTVFADGNGNAILDAGEASTTTAANGAYALALTPGTITIREIVPGGFVQVGTPPSITIVAGQTISNINIANATKVAAATQINAVGSGAANDRESRVRVYRADGSFILEFAPYPGFKGGATVATGDVTGDGVEDLITGAGATGGPHVRVFDGAALLAGSVVQVPGPIGSFFAYDASFTGGVFVAAGDVNGDGRADVITGAGAGGGPHVIAYDAVTRARLASFFAFPAGFTGGVTVAAGDITGDHRADIITGAGAGGGPIVRVFNVTTGAPAIVREFLAYRSDFHGGVNVAAGDLNGDGISEIVTGAGAGGGPHVKVFDSASLTEIASFYAYDVHFEGGVRVAVGDYDNDGILEVITGAGPLGGPHVRSFELAGPTLNANFYAFDPGFMSGVFVG